VSTRERRERVTFALTPPYDLASTIAWLHGRGSADDRVRRDGRAFVSAFRAGRGAASARLEASARALTVDLVLSPGADLDVAVRRARKLAGLPADAATRDPHGAFVRLARRDAPLAGALRACRGLRMPQHPDPVAAITGAILAQQVTTSFAAQLLREVFAKWGERVRIGGEEWLLPPRPEALAELGPADLRPLKVSGRKAEYIRDLNRELADGTLDLDALASLSADDATAALVARRGIGPTTASWLLMFGAGHPDAWPVADVGLWRALERTLGAKAGRDIDRFIARYAGYRSWLAVLLWS
jgi:3-methyladenine DNA glycosylase/8-oxoguanine DNA glycosylase